LTPSHAALGGIYMVNWRGTAAEQAFQRAYELNPADAAVLAAYGRFKRYRGEYAEGIPLLRRAVELDPENWLRRNQLGIAYARLRNYDASATSLRRCVELIPANVGCLVNLALAEIAQGNPDDALGRLHVVEALTTAGFRLAQLADAYAQMDNHEEAARFFSVFENAARETPASDAVWVMAYLAVGDDERALERLESAVNNRVLTDFAPLTMLQSNPWDDPVLDRPEFRKLFTGLWSE
jgi:tetratricopeptide (TPR) repeat protein